MVYVEQKIGGIDMVAYLTAGLAVLLCIGFVAICVSPIVFIIMSIIMK